MQHLTTARDERTVEASGPCLVIVGPESSATFSLPTQGSTTVGRGADAGIVVSDPLVSRLHVRVRVDGDRLEVQDLQSANGTRVHASVLAPGTSAHLACGQSVTIGATTLIFHHGGRLPGRRRAWPHAYFSARVQHECVNARNTCVPFGVVTLQIGNAPSSQLIIDVLSPLLRPIDVLGQQDANVYELLLPEMAPLSVIALARDLVARLQAGGVAAHSGHACYGRDGETAETLLSAAFDRTSIGTSSTDGNGETVVRSPCMQRLYELAERVAARDINLIVTGETGAGKEVLVQRIHRMSPRAKAPLVALNCAALSESLLESELFGHERGAFTGAVAAKPGLLETAPGGTVFLDEIGEMPLSLQAKLLRVIETREVRRLGGLKPRPIDVRIIAATHRDLRTQVAAGTFRQDMFFRLNGVTLTIPPLRERREEILPLAKHFLDQFLPDHPLALSTEAADWMIHNAWAGNIRELRNVVECAATLCPDGLITIEHLSPNGVTPVSGSEPPPSGWDGPHDERDRVMSALATCGGNQSRAAKLLGIARSTLIEKIKRYGIRRPQDVQIDGSRWPS